MPDFSVEWLALREPVDKRCRSARVTQAVADALPRAGSIAILDLAAGTGSNRRYLTDYLRSSQEWLLVDKDAALLERAGHLASSAVETRVTNLSSIDGQRDLFAGRDLVTASAFLDLVSEPWLQSVVAACREHQTAVLFALSYDGRMVCSPTEPEDDFIRDLVNRHQRTDKGFGPALGPDAAVHVSRQLESFGYRVIRDASDWTLGPEAGELQRQLIQWWAEAATALAPQQSDTIADWRARRLEHLLEGRSHIVVGHEDVGAFIA